MKDIKIVDMYWDGDTLVIETDDSRVTHFKGAYISDFKCDYSGYSDVVEVKELDLNATNKFK